MLGLMIGTIMVVRITDEFNTTWSVECGTDAEVLRVVAEWLSGRDQTPIYEIVIEI
jgi:hypothetical protein